MVPIRKLEDLKGKKILLNNFLSEFAAAFAQVTRAEVIVTDRRRPDEFLNAVRNAHAHGVEIMQANLDLADALNLMEMFPVLNLAGITANPTLGIASNRMEQTIDQQKVAQLYSVIKEAATRQTEEELKLELDLLQKIRGKYNFNQEFPRPAFRNAFLAYFSGKDSNVAPIAQAINSYQRS
jgi:hypothetical protein